MGRKPETRPVRVANCSGYHGDPAYEMYRQATLGDVDFITGDYLAEVNLANNAQAWRAEKHPGYEETAWEGLQQTIDVISEKGIRVVINGGALDPKALDPKALAQKVSAKNLKLRVAYLSGDDLYPTFGPNMPTTKEELQHLDSGNPSIVPSELSFAFLGTASENPVPMVSAHAYLGARGIVDGLRRGADIIICGRVADASPVIAAAWFWHGWSETDYDELAGSLIAGHLIECSAYVTGANFAGFDNYPLEDLIAPGFPIAEIDKDGTCVVTKHPGTQGMVTVDTVRCQFLYELQGSVYLNSDVNAFIGDVAVEDVGKDRAGFACLEFGGPLHPRLRNLQSSIQKWDLIEKQIRHFLPDTVVNDLETLEFQRVGVPASNPISQLASTTYLRIFIASRSERSVAAVALSLKNISLKHFSGTLPFLLYIRLNSPKLTNQAFTAPSIPEPQFPHPFLAYYPALIPQSDLNEEIHFLDNNGSTSLTSFNTGHPPSYKALAPRENYDDPEPPPNQNHHQGPTKQIRLGDITLARSGDKGSNLNIGFFVPTPDPDPRHWAWLRTYMTRSQLRDLLGEDFEDSFFIERVEFPRIQAVHFVVYGILGRGVSSSSRLDGFGKGVADYIRDRVVDVPGELVN